MEYGVAIAWLIGILLIFAVMWYMEKTKTCVDCYTENDNDCKEDCPDKLEPKGE